MSAGDAIFLKVAPSGNIVSRLIGAAQLALGLGKGDATEYSHVAIDMGDGTLVEAYFPRARRVAIGPRIAGCSVEWWGVLGASDAQRQLACEAAKDRVGEFYNILFLPWKWTDKRLEYCSQLFNDCYEAAGIDLDDKDEIVSPDDLAGSGKLIRIK